MSSFLVEMLDFLKSRRKLWMAPLILVLVVLGALLIAAQGSVIAPFIYTLF
jgi:fluoride ion exporter CrcB/FEX